MRGVIEVFLFAIGEILLCTSINIVLLDNNCIYILLYDGNIIENYSFG